MCYRLTNTNFSETNTLKLLLNTAFRNLRQGRCLVQATLEGASCHLTTEPSRDWSGEPGRRGTLFRTAARHVSVVLQVRSVAFAGE